MKNQVDINKSYKHGLISQIQSSLNLRFMFNKKKSNFQLIQW